MYKIVCKSCIVELYYLVINRERKEKKTMDTNKDNTVNRLNISMGFILIDR